MRGRIEKFRVRNCAPAAADTAASVVVAAAANGQGVTAESRRQGKETEIQRSPTFTAEWPRVEQAKALNGSHITNAA